MMHRLTLVLALLYAAPAFSAVQIAGFQASHGPYGPERLPSDAYPLDEYYFRFTISGVKADETGKTSDELTLKLIGPGKKELFSKTGPVGRELFLGGDSFLWTGFFNIPDKAPPGEYQISIVYKDKIAKESATVERKFTVLPAAPKIIVPRFVHDADGKIPASSNNVVGQNIYYRLRVIGFDRSKNKVETRLSMQVLDNNGKEMLKKPIVVDAGLKDPDAAAKATQVNFNGMLTLTRPGTYKVVFTVEDLSTGRKVTQELPLRVLEP